MGLYEDLLTDGSAAWKDVRSRAVTGGVFKHQGLGFI